MKLRTWPVVSAGVPCLSVRDLLGGPVKAPLTGGYRAMLDKLDVVELRLRCLVQQLVVHADLPRWRHGDALGREEGAQLPRVLKRMRLVVDGLRIEVERYGILLCFLFEDRCVRVPTVRLRVLDLKFSEVGLLEVLVRILHILYLGLCHRVVLLVLVLFVLSARRTEEVGDPLLHFGLLALHVRCIVRVEYAYVYLHGRIVLLLDRYFSILQPSRTCDHSFF